MVGVKYTGPYRDFSGYAEAARNYILAIHSAGIPITIEPRVFDRNPPEVASSADVDTLLSLEGKKINYDVNIIHLTPDLWRHHTESGKYNIGIFAWETGLLHPLWVQSCNAVDEVWVPSDYNINVLRHSGVTVPIHKVRHGIDVNSFDGITSLDLAVDDDTLVFYSIFQWMYRKNPEGLLRAYFNAFSSSDNVLLLLKTYFMGDFSDIDRIKSIIAGLKKDMGLNQYPRVSLLPSKLTREQILQLHMTGDCYVSLHRGEGFGLPLLEAGLAGNGVIATAYSGNLEFMADSNSYLVPYIESYVSHMSSFNPWYLGNQVWAEPNIVAASNIMRSIFESSDDMKQKGSLLREHIVSNFSWDSVAEEALSLLNNR